MTWEAGAPAAFAPFALLLAGTVASSCCKPCARPSIAGVPPAGAERLELAVPLSDADRATLEGFLLGCGPAGGAICEATLSARQTCVLKKLAAPPPSSSKAGAEALAKCSEHPGFTLEVLDARADGSRVLRGAVVDGSAFVLYPDGLPPGYDGRAHVVVFADYVPEPAP